MPPVPIDGPPRVPSRMRIGIAEVRPLARHVYRVDVPRSTAIQDRSVPYDGPVLMDAALRGGPPSTSLPGAGGRPQRGPPALVGWGSRDFHLPPGSVGPGRPRYGPAMATES